MPTLNALLIKLWYGNDPRYRYLQPLSAVFLGIVKTRQWLYYRGILSRSRLRVPVIVVGNISVGGTGKTPLTLYLAQLLLESGYQPAIISRGYGGAGKVQQVFANSLVSQVGDEPLLMAQRLLCPVAIAKKRREAGELLLRDTPCNVLLADDGLQHYALQRDIEIALIDGQRGVGNGQCLPAGPLREPQSRLQSVDFTVVNGGQTQAGQFAMQLQGDTLINLCTGEQQTLSRWRGKRCHSVAAIGNPERFFQHLRGAGLDCITHPFSDHYPFSAADIEFADDLPVLMTEKDAVKCRPFARPNQWYLPINAQLSADFAALFLTKLSTIQHDR